MGDQGCVSKVNCHSLAGKAPTTPESDPLKESDILRELDPLKDNYYVSETDLVLYGPVFRYTPNRLFLETGITGRSVVTGRSRSESLSFTAPKSLGKSDVLKALLPGVGVKAGGAGLYLDPKSVYPFDPLSLVSGEFDGIYLYPASGIGAGILFTNGKSISVSPHLAGIMALISVVGVAARKKETGGGEFFADFLSDILPNLLPVNTLREILQGIGLDMSSNACKEIKDKNGLRKCMSYVTSYKKQGIFKTAKDAVEHALAQEHDPYTMAELMLERDVIVTLAESKGLPVPASDKIISGHIKAAVDQTSSFIGKYGNWLGGVSSERPPEAEIHTFMANTLYLLNKLKMSCVFDGVEKELKITASSPVAFDGGPVDVVAFFQTIARAYEALTSRALWKYIRNKGGELESRIIKATLGKKTDILVRLWLEYEPFIGWIGEVRSLRFHSLFELRKLHLCGKMKDQYKDEAVKYIEQIVDIRLSDGEEIDDALDAGADDLGSQVLDNLSPYYNGLVELDHIRTLSAESRGLDDAISRGLDFTDEQEGLVTGAFNILYALLRRRSKYPEDKYLKALENHYRAVITRIGSENGAKLFFATASYPKMINELKSRIEGHAVVIFQTMRKVAKKRLYSKKCVDEGTLDYAGKLAGDIYKDTLALYRCTAGLSTEWFRSIADLIEVEQGESGQLWELTYRIEAGLAQLDRLVTSLKGMCSSNHELLNEIGKVKNEFQKIVEALNRLKAASMRFNAFRASMNTMFIGSHVLGLDITPPKNNDLFSYWGERSL